MKKFGNGSAPSVVFAVIFIIGTTGLTVFSTCTFVNWLNADADMRYAVAVDAAVARQSQAMPNDRVNDNNDSAVNESSEDGSSLVDQSGGDISSKEDKPVKPSDTIVSAGDSEAVTYPYSIGKRFVVVDPEGNMIYLVKKGDTLSGISGIVGYSVDELAKYNHIKNVNRIYTGESLRIPAGDGTVESAKQYIEEHEANKLLENKAKYEDATLKQTN